MSIVLDGLTGITTPGLTNTGTETLVNLTTTGNTILGDASTDTLNVGNGGLVKDASGNVGIGTASPKGVLDVTSAGAYVPVLLTTTNTASSAQRNWMISTSWNLIGDLSFVTSNAIGGNPVSAGTTRMMIDASGNVGIGTISPSTYGGQLVSYKTSGNGTYFGYSNSGTFPKVSAIGLGSDAVGFTHTSNGSTFALSGSAQIAAIQSASANATTDMAFYTTAGGTVTERMRIDSSGNVGIGVTPSAWTNGRTALQIGGNTVAGLGFAGAISETYTNAYVNSGVYKYYTTGPAGLFQFNNASSGGFSWHFAGSGTAGNTITWTQAMTLDSSGNLLVGTTTALTTGRFVLKAPATTNLGEWRVSTNGYGMIMYNASDTQVGYISINASTTTYNTGSDYRLKENIAPMTGALAKVAQLKPCTFTWKATGENGQGFIAHELSEVVPDAVSGQKDAVDAEGNPRYQGIDTSFLVATLTAAIKEQQALIQQLQADVAALKGSTPA